MSEGKRNPLWHAEPETNMTATKQTAHDQIAAAVVDYAIFHEVDTDAVDVTESYGGEGNVVRFRLSLDTDGRSRGRDEWYDVV